MLDPRQNETKDSETTPSSGEDRIIRVVGLPKEGLTSHERCLDMLKQLEIKMNTGPIIGEAREVILSLLDNLYVRDLFIGTMSSMTPKQMEELFIMSRNHIHARDEEIMLKRASSDSNQASV